MSHARAALVVDDDEGLRTVTSQTLARDGWDVHQAGLGAEVPALARSGDFGLVVLDQALPDADGVELLEEIREDGYVGSAVVVTGHPSVQKAIEALGSAATDYLCKPVSHAELLRISRRARETDPAMAAWDFLWGTLRKRYGFRNVLSADECARECYITAARVADSRAGVLIEGETGTGKEYLARAIHYMSSRRDGPFVAVNCGAIPEALLESELFGHEKGAFTSATSAKKGIFELADGGTLLLDEVGELSPGAQVKLLRFLQERNLTRLGGLKPVEVDVRVIAATNRDLTAGMREGKFREDLYYRLAVVPLFLPPLRERPCDIGLYARHFLAEARRDADRGSCDLADDALEALRAHSWPGNLRELHNVISRAALLARRRPVRAGDVRIMHRGGSALGPQLALLSA
jgi:DNA-binding NtrC family response regulator